MQESFEKQKAVLSETVKVSKEKELRELYLSIQDQTLNYQRELQEMERELKEPLLTKIDKITDEVAKDKVDFEVEESSHIVGYARNRKDLTEEVIKAYNTKYPSTPGKK